jgi:murein DD-endopeptidase MepM/ murein hydrolase activator NlpD
MPRKPVMRANAERAAARKAKSTATSAAMNSAASAAVISAASAAAGVVRVAKRKKYAVLGAKVMCNKGSHIQSINLPTGHGTKVNGRPILDEYDNKYPENIPCFGTCSSSGNNSDETVSYYAQSVPGTVTGKPCVPHIIAPWNDTAQDVFLWDNRVLTTDSYLVCLNDGKIVFVTSGQEADAPAPILAPPEEKPPHPYPGEMSDLNEKERTAAVRRVQIWLAELGYLLPKTIINDRSNGSFGNNTQNALNAFRKDRGLLIKPNVDKNFNDINDRSNKEVIKGTIDETVWNTLQKEYYEKSEINDKNTGVTFINPLTKKMNVISEFGRRDPGSSGGSKDHRGIDFTEEGSVNADIKASIAGTVVLSTGNVEQDEINSRGKTVVIQSSEKDNLYVVLQHLSSINEDLIRVEEKVTPDTVVGVMGGTGGNTSFGVHLHYEIIVGDLYTEDGRINSMDAAINPWILLPPQ